MNVYAIEESLCNWLLDLGYKVAQEPTTPIDAGQVAVFFTRAEVEDSAYPNQYKFTAHFELVFVEKERSNCFSKIT
ncbi:MAG: hypothetical protein WBJ87_02640, partial [Candidatus Hydrothermia bacterium]